MENVILATFEDRSTPYQALEALRHLADDDSIELRGAAIIERHDDGRWRIPEESETASYAGTLTGGAVGGLLGLLAGPGGLLLGAAAGFLVGSAAERDDVERVETILHSLPRRVPPGTTALVADLYEEVPDLVDRTLKPLAASMERMTRAEVETDLEEAARNVATTDQP